MYQKARVFHKTKLETQPVTPPLAHWAHLEVMRKRIVVSAAPQGVFTKLHILSGFNKPDCLLQAIISNPM
jgi:hypothetical protein